MELSEFLKQLENSFRSLPFVLSWTLEQANTYVKIRVVLKKKSFLHVFYNARLRIQSFALVLHEERIWGLDRDNRLGWHEHPLGNPEKHISIDEPQLEYIIQRIESVWNQIPDKQ
jgi:hypothetical protein